MKLLSVLIITTTLMGTSFGCSEDGSSGFLPSNNMRIPVGAKTNGGLTETQFNNVITKVEQAYFPIVSSYGARLSIERNWNDGTVNAYAHRMNNTWHIGMYGGLARHSTMSEDGFALVVCHELGHHIGGAPQKEESMWASNEGQADYFATLKCLRRVWNFDNNIEIVRKMIKNIPSSLFEACGRNHVWNTDVAMCIRASMAGLSVSKLFRSLKGGAEPRFETPARGVVFTTDHNHPDYQCRLDTFLQGSLCEKSFNEDVSGRDEVQGTCHRSTGHTIGLRPTCWYRPSR